MKKIISFVLLIMALIFPINNINANTQSEITSESVSLIPLDLVEFSNVDFYLSAHISSGYTTLLMGNSTTYTIDLSTIGQYLEYYSAPNVSNVYLQFDLQAMYTGHDESTYQWLSPNGNWNKDTKRLSLGTSIPVSTSIEIWWNLIGESGGAPSITSGTLRIYSITLVVEYTEAIQPYTLVTDWSQLPAGTSPFSSYESYDQFFQDGNMIVPYFEKNLNDTYDIYYNFDDGSKYMSLGITLPSTVIYKDVTTTLYFATTEYRFLWFFYDINPSNIFDSDFLLWNLTTGEFQQIITGTIYGVPFVTGNGISTYNMAYVDLVIPFQLDKILQVKMSYEYRYHYLIGRPGDWNKVTSQDLYEGAKTDVNNPWWNPVARLLYDEILNDSVGTLWEYDQIEVVNDEYNLDKKVDFTNYINENKELTLNVTEVFSENYTVGRIFLGQFDKLGSNGVEVKDIVLMNIRYMSDGIEYSLAYPEQVIADSPVPSNPIGSALTDLLEEVWKIISSLWIVACIIVGFITARITFALVPTKGKHPFVFIAIVIAVTLILYYSYTPPKTLW